MKEYDAIETRHAIEDDVDAFQLHVLNLTRLDLTRSARGETRTSKAFRPSPVVAHSMKRDADCAFIRG